jgi:hypothetical protein
MPYGTINADLLVSQSGGSLSADSSVFRNRLINGSQLISQRYAGVLQSNINNYITDRWSVANGISGVSMGQSTTAPAGFTNSLYVTTTTGAAMPVGNTYNLGQCIEANNVTDLGYGTANAKTVTVSFWVRSSVIGSFALVLNNGNPSLSTPATRSYVTTYTINVADTWEYKTVTIAGDQSGTWNTSGVGIGLNLAFDLGTGSNFNTATTNAWQTGNYLRTSSTASIGATTNATFYITGVQLERGSTASSFEYRQYGTELVLCQRYCVLFAKSTGVSQEIIGAGQAWGSTNYWCAVRMPVTMRSYPTMSATTGTNYWLWQSGGTSSYSTAVADPGYYGSAYLGNLIYITTVSGIPSGQGLVLSAANNGATLLYTAEL